MVRQDEGLGVQSPSISAHGRFVAFASYDNDLVPGDTNKSPDVFLHDAATGQLQRVSVAWNGGQANDFSLQPDLSADGRFVAFMSYASNLVPGDRNGVPDVFVRDLAEQTTELVSVSTAGRQAEILSNGPKISADGRFVAFYSADQDLAPHHADFGGIYLRDRRTGVTRLMSVGVDGRPMALGIDQGTAISPGGRFVAFTGDASGFPGDGDDQSDVYLRNRTSTRTVRVSQAPDGAAALGVSSSPAVSRDGRFVAFVSTAPNLVPGDRNGVPDVFVRDLTSGAVVRVSVHRNGAEATRSSQDPSIAADGRSGTFLSEAGLVRSDTDKAVDVYVWDLDREQVRQASVDALDLPHTGNLAADMSADGRHVAFAASASKPDFTPVEAAYVRDRFDAPAH